MNPTLLQKEEQMLFDLKYRNKHCSWLVSSPPKNSFSIAARKRVFYCLKFLEEPEKKHPEGAS
jgi:hypothetical protein